MSEKKRIVIANDEDIARYASETGASAEGSPPGDGKGPHDRQDAGDASGDADGAAASEAGQTVESLRVELAACKDKLLRAQAECANTSRRLNQQHANSMKLARMDLARSLLPIVDDFERTMRSLEESATDDPVLQGVRLIQDHFIKALKEHGIEPFESLGRIFDPNVHEAMMRDTESDQPPGTITAVLQCGYKMNDRVLRPAKVAVVAEASEAASDRGSESLTEGPSSSVASEQGNANDADL